MTYETYLENAEYCRKILWLFILSNCFVIVGISLHRTGAKFDEAKQTVTKFTEQECTPVPKVKPKLQIGKPFRPSFDLNDMMEYLKSPASCFTPRKDSRVSNSSFALDEFVGDQLRKAVENMGANASKTSDMENANNVEGHNSKTDVARPVGRNRDKVDINKISSLLNLVDIRPCSN